MQAPPAPNPHAVPSRVLLRAYASGIFPMAQDRDDPRIFWMEPEMRGILPLDGFHLSRSLARRIRQGGMQVTVDRDFAGVMLGCAARPSTWINDTILQMYQQLHREGHAHSLEVWQDGELAGGVYGLALGAAFFGESMFSRRPDASKVALAYLVARLRAGGFQLFDTQFTTPHLLSLGARDIPQAEYMRRLPRILEMAADFMAQPSDVSSEEVLTMHRSTQTS